MDKTVQIFKSSAGSGKTYTLVREYLGLALADPKRYRQLLAITFTNKAAAEMKERIIKALRELSAGENQGLADELNQLHQIDLAIIPERASTILSLILHDYANFAVSTIDSFTSRIVRNFAHDLELPSRFDVESDTSQLLEKMVDRLMDQVGQDPFITQILVNFSEEKLAEEGNWDLEKDLNSVSKEIFTENSQPFLALIRNMEGDRFVEFIAHIRDVISKYTSGIQPLIEKVIDMLDKAGLEGNEFKGGKYSIITYLKKIPAAKKPKDFSDIFTKKSVLEAVEEGKWTTKKDPIVDAHLAKGLESAILDVYQFHKMHFENYVTGWYAYQNIHSLAVIQQVEELVDNYKEQNNIVLISDFQRKISKFIQAESADYIYWRLGEKYKYFMLDEFQDTSELQWKNLFPLFENMVAEAEPDGSVLLVGDSKQAIYRWRGGEVELLEYVAPQDLNTEPQVLSTNWRSGETIVEFNNVFFNSLREFYPDNALTQAIYDQFHQQTSPGNHGTGFVQLKPFDREGFKDKAKAATLEAIHQVLNDGYKMGDIAILVRSANDGADVARMLAGENIPVISSDSLLLYKEPVISFIVSVFKHLANPSDQVARAEVLHFQLYYLQKPISETGILEFDSEPGEEGPNPAIKFREILKSENMMEEFRNEMPEEFRKLRWKLDKTPLYELAEEVVRIFKLNETAQAYVQQFLDVVLDYSSRKRSDLDGFLDFWNDKKNMLAISVPAGVDAVEILTIHKSKGLEFPVVILPFLNWTVKPKADSTFWAESGSDFTKNEEDAFLISPREELKDSRFSAAYEQEKQKTLLDNINMLYVAFTRPRERLYGFYLDKIEAESAKKSKTEPSMYQVGNLIGAVIKKSLQSSVLSISEGYEAGMEMPPVKPSKPKTASSADELISVPWNKRIRMERKHKKHWNATSPTDLDESNSSFPLETVAAEALRRLDLADSLPRILKDLVEEGILTSQDHISLRIKLDRILSDPIIAKWFSPEVEVRKEAEILTDDAELYAPNRLVIHENIAQVIDFAHGDDFSDSQKNQKKYAKVLKQMGFKKVETFIYNIGVEEFVG